MVKDFNKDNNGMIVVTALIGLAIICVLMLFVYLDQTNHNTNTVINNARNVYIEESNKCLKEIDSIKTSLEYDNDGGIIPGSQDTPEYMNKLIKCHLRLIDIQKDYLEVLEKYAKK